MERGESEMPLRRAQALAQPGWCRAVGYTCVHRHTCGCVSLPICIDSLGPETSFAAGLTQGAGSVCTLDPMVGFNPMSVTAY